MQASESEYKKEKKFHSLFCLFFHFDPWKSYFFLTILRPYLIFELERATLVTGFKLL